jgi:hypothetical protein
MCVCVCAPQNHKRPSATKPHPTTHCKTLHEPPPLPFKSMLLQLLLQGQQHLSCAFMGMSNHCCHSHHAHLPQPSHIAAAHCCHSRRALLPQPLHICCHAYCCHSRRALLLTRPWRLLGGGPSGGSGAGTTPWPVVQQYRCTTGGTCVAVREWQYRRNNTALLVVCGGTTTTAKQKK